MKKIKVIGVPMDLGASRRGVDMGPSAVRIAALGTKLRALGHEVVDFGNIDSHVPESIHYSEEKDNDKTRKYLAEIVGACTKLSKATHAALSEGWMPLVLGGDHSISIGSVAGISKFYREKSKKIGLIWLDAHADINTPETSISGNIHGMPFAHILGYGAKELLNVSSFTPMVEVKNAVLIGIRDLDEAEKQTIKKLGVKAFTMRDIDEMGLRRVMEEAILTASNGTEGFHVSCDVDWVDPADAPGVGTPVNGGATYREAHLAMELIFDSSKMLSLEVTEVNPVLDHSNQTAELAVEMICSAFGKKIL